MYHLAPYYDVQPNVNCADVMYHMRNFQEDKPKASELLMRYANNTGVAKCYEKYCMDSSVTGWCPENGRQDAAGDGRFKDALTDIGKRPADKDELKRRQEALIDRLRKVRSSLDEVLSDIHVSLPLDQTKAFSPLTILKELREEASWANFPNNAALQDMTKDGGMEVCLHLNPELLCPSLSILFNILSLRRSDFSLKIFVHSSVLDLPIEVRHMLFTESTCQQKEKFIFNIIWRNISAVQNPCLSVNDSTIFGEVPVCKFLAIIASLYDASVSSGGCSDDYWLDMATRYRRSSHDSAVRICILKLVSAQLDKSGHRFLLGPEVSLCDVVFWSALCHSSDEGQLPTEVDEWFSRCASQPCFKETKTVLDLYPKVRGQRNA